MIRLLHIIGPAHADRELLAAAIVNQQWRLGQPAVALDDADVALMSNDQVRDRYAHMQAATVCVISGARGARHADLAPGE